MGLGWLAWLGGAAAAADATSFACSQVEGGALHGGVLALARSGLVLTHAFGSAPPPSPNNAAGLRDGVPIEPDSIFLVASLTKPVTCTAVMQLVEQGKLSLDTPVCSLLPACTGGGKEHITVHHLLTHTSGLPDGIPENQEYRRRHATLAEFAERMCELDLLFPPGTSVSYQSAGINLLGSIVQIVSGQPLPVYLRENVFGPLGMRDTTLGIATDRAKGREVPCFLDPERNKVQSEDVLPTEAHMLTSNDAEDAHCNWNSDYWRELGTPWGGLLTTATDYSLFLQSFVYSGGLLSGGGARILKPETAQQMTAVDNTSKMPQMSAEAAAEESYGIGWRRNQGSSSRERPGMWGGHGDEPDGEGAAWERTVVYGHGGATGATAFADPVSGMTCCLATTDPSLGESGIIRAVGEMVLAAARDGEAVQRALQNKEREFTNEDNRRKAEAEGSSAVSARAAL